VSLRIGSEIKTVKTNGSGVASATLSLVDIPGATQVAASFAGDTIDQLAPSSDAQPFTIDPQNTTLTLTGPAGAIPGAPSGLVATLKDSDGNPIAFRSIVFVMSGTGTGFTRQASTGADGKAALGNVPSLPYGVYSVKAYFSGTITLNPWAASPATVTLVDPVYNPSASGTLTYGVQYPFTGFFSPVDNLPTLNTANAGSAIPVKFSLGGDRGLAIFLAGYPKVTQIACSGSAPTDLIEETTTSNSGLTYGGGQYTYVWKTPKTYAGKCFQFQLGLIDGSSRLANFKFK
jgi:hypothetical protein